MADKNRFLIEPENIKQLIEPMGFGLVSDKITTQGNKVGYMYREEPEDEADSGWRFLSGTETQEYVENPNNSMLFEVNTIANYDPAIIPYINFPAGTELERKKDTDEFIPVEE